VGSTEGSSEGSLLIEGKYDGAELIVGDRDGSIVIDGCSEGLLETDGTVDGGDDWSGVGPWLTDGEIDDVSVMVMEVEFNGPFRDHGYLARTTVRSLTAVALGVGLWLTDVEVEDVSVCVVVGVVDV